jgi:hypothetical protein
MVLPNEIRPALVSTTNGYAVLCVLCVLGGSITQN